MITVVLKQTPKLIEKSWFFYWVRLFVRLCQLDPFRLYLALFWSLLTPISPIENKENRAILLLALYIVNMNWYLQCEKLDLVANWKLYSCFSLLFSTPHYIVPGVRTRYFSTRPTSPKWLRDRVASNGITLEAEDLPHHYDCTTRDWISIGLELVQPDNLEPSPTDGTVLDWS